MVAQQILVLFVVVRIRLGQNYNICGFGVMVAYRLSKARELFDSTFLLKTE